MVLAKQFLLGSVFIGLAGLVIHSTHPQFLTSLMENDSIISATKAVLKFMDNIYPGSQNIQSARGGGKGKKQERLFTTEELLLYDGKEGKKGPYLAILGRVYNVKKGKKHYGPGGGYEFFAGRDASRAFVSGDFSEEGLVDDISGLASADYIGLDDWIKFYEKDYKYVGKLIGRYNDDEGKPTEYSHLVNKWISEAHQQKEDENQEKKMFPPCNSEWTPEDGSRVWCSSKSGGIKRDWIGVPRKFFNPGQTRPRCACIKNKGPPSHDPHREPHDDRGDLDHPNIVEYKGCHPDASACYVKEE